MIHFLTNSEQHPQLQPRIADEDIIVMQILLTNRTTYDPDNDALCFLRENEYLTLHEGQRIKFDGEIAHIKVDPSLPDAKVEIYHDDFYLHIKNAPMAFSRLPYDSIEDNAIFLACLAHQYSEGACPLLTYGIIPKGTPYWIGNRYDVAAAEMFLFRPIERCDDYSEKWERRFEEYYRGQFCLGTKAEELPCRYLKAEEIGPSMKWPPIPKELKDKDTTSPVINILMLFI